MRLALALLACFAATPVLADAVTYRGTVGAREVVLELTEPSNGAVAGRFAFLDTGESIPLNPRSHSADFILWEEARCLPGACAIDPQAEDAAAPEAAEWTLRVVGTTLTGHRRPRGQGEPEAITASEIGRRPFSGDPVPQTLHEYLIDAAVMISGEIDWRNLHFERVLTGVPLEATGARQVGAATVVQLADPRTRFPFPRVSAFEGGEPVERVNEILAGRHAELSVSALSCLSSGYIGFGYAGHGFNRPSRGDYDSETIDLTYASPRLVSWVEAGSLYCGGAHPYNHFNSYSRDVQTGRPLDLSRIFHGWRPYAYGGGPADLEVARAAPEDYRWRPDAALIAFVLNRALQDDPEGDDWVRDNCVDEQALADYLTIRFKPGPRAVFTLSGFPHAAAVCNGDLFSAPLTDLGDLLAPGADDYFADLTP